MIRRATHTTRSEIRERGFTLLEVLVAVAIFAVCLAGIYMSFGTSARAFSHGREAVEAMQTLRVSADQMTRDLHAVYFETNYNERFSRLKQEMVRDEDRLLQALDDRRLGGTASTSATPLLDYAGLDLNLQFLGTDGGDADTLEFAHFLPSQSGVKSEFLGAERVSYRLEKGDLTCQRSRVFRLMRLNPNLEEEIIRSREEREANQDEITPEEQKRRRAGDVLRSMGIQDAAGSAEDASSANYFVEIPQEAAPGELLARNVVSLDVKYGYYFDGWKEADSWNSEAKQFRSPAFEVPPDDPHYVNKRVLFETRPSDGLPSYVRIRIGLGEPDSAKLRREGTAPRIAHQIESIVWLPASVETYTPADKTVFAPATDQAKNAPSPATRGGNP